MEELEGRTAVVIGGSGVGRGIALALAGERMSVAVADIHRESAEAVRDEVALVQSRHDSLLDDFAFYETS